MIFHPGLNSILGGKGTGKSLLIEFLRFVLNSAPSHENILEDHQGKLDKRLGQYETIEIEVVDGTGKNYNIKRSYDPEGGDPYENIDYDPAQVFPVLFLSQNEIVSIAEDENEQLEFIDRFFDFKNFVNNIKNLESQLQQLDRDMAESLNSFPIVKNLKIQIASMEHEIKRLDLALKNPTFEKYQEVEKKDQAFQGQSDYATNLRRVSSESLTKFQQLKQPALPKNLEKDPALKRTLDVITKRRSEAEEKIQVARTELVNLEKDINNELNNWKPVFNETKEKYDRLVESSGGDYQSLARERTSKIRQIEDLRKKLEIEERRKGSAGQISAERDILLDQLEEIYDLYTKARKEKSASFQEQSAGRLQLRILESSNSDVFRNRLLDLKQGSYLREVEIDQICKEVKPRDFVLALLRYESTDKKNMKTIKDVSDKAGIQLNRMGQLAQFLLEKIPYEELLELQYKATPQDRPEILYNIGEEVFRPLNEVSVGQKSIALLIMALSDGTMPVVIDQPEDSLDIRSIWEDVCLKLRKGKDERQFISTTHSSSVAVSSDTDKFIILEGTATKGKVLYSGSMDHNPVSEEVIKYLEGGIDSYSMKHAKYQIDKQKTNG